jgi:hypothetical protein
MNRAQRLCVKSCNGTLRDIHSQKVYSVMMQKTQFGFAVAWLTVAAMAVQAGADAISINLGANSNPGAAAAGAVPAPNWNNTTLGFVNLALKDSSGAVVPGLTATETTTYGACNTSYANANFSASADTGMMGSDNYVGVGGAKPGLRVTFSGTIPYPIFDVYVYTHSGLVGAYTQDVFVLSGIGGDLGLNKIAKDIDGTATSYREASATVSGNYVVFRGVSRDMVGSNFIVQAGGGAHSGEFGYMNGIQIVDVTARSNMVVPEPDVIPLLGTGMVTLLWPVFGKRNIINKW